MFRASNGFWIGLYLPLGCGGRERVRACVRACVRARCSLFSFVIICFVLTDIESKSCGDASVYDTAREHEEAGTANRVRATLFVSVEYVATFRYPAYTQRWDLVDD